MQSGELLLTLGIAAGSALGGVLRYLLDGVVARTIGQTYPWGTLLINVLGSLLIGFIFTVSGPDGRLLLTPFVRQSVMVGILGGFTTFSAFSLQTLNLVRLGEWGAAVTYVLLSVGLALVAVWLGATAGEILNR
jgi:CrcB protein